MSDAIIQLKVADTFTYGPDKICSAKISNAVFDTFGVGSCHSAQVDIVMSNTSDVIPKMAKLVLTATVDGVVYPKGTYFIDTREVDSASDTVYPYDTLTIHGFDAMIKGDKPMIDAEDPAEWLANTQYHVEDIVRYSNKNYKCKEDHTSGSSFDSSKWEETEIGNQGEWPQKASVALSTIANQLGVAVDSASMSLVSSKNYMVQYPGYGENGYTYRDVLGYIGAMYAGNWIISEDNKLKLIQLNESKSAKIIANYDKFTAQPKTETYTRVSVECGNDVSFTAGNDTGLELVVDCPWGNQEIADYIWSRVNGFEYRAYEAENILYSMDLTLGDKITVENVNSYIYDYSVELDYMSVATISAPGDSETEHEYGYQDSSERRIRRNENNVKELKTEFVVRAGEVYSLISGNLRDYRQPTDPSKETGAKINIGDNWYNTTNNVLYRWNGDDWDEIGLAAVANYPAWEPSKSYKRFDMVTYNNLWYEAKEDHTSGSSFDPSKWEVKKSVQLSGQSQIYQTLDGISISVESTGAGSSITLNAGGIVQKSSGPMYFETDEAHFTGQVSAAKVAVEGSNGYFVITKEVAGEIVPVGFIGYGQGSTGMFTTDGVRISSATTDSTQYPAWQANHDYIAGDRVVYNHRYLMCTTDHHSWDDISQDCWTEFSGPYVPHQTSYALVAQTGVGLCAPGHMLRVDESGCYADGKLIGTGQAVFG